MKYPTLWKIAALLVSQACINPALAAATKPASSKGYTVKSGDTFAKIARANGVPLNDLLKANHLSNPDHIHLGQRVTIPGGKATARTSATAKTSATKAATSKAPAKTIAQKQPARKPQPARPQQKETTTTVDVTPPPVPGSYVVQSGDTLGRIQHKTGTSVASLMKLNGLKENSVLRPGQKLATNTRTAVAQNQPLAQPKAPAPQPFIQEPVLTAPAPPRIIEQPMPPTPAPQAPAPATTTAPHKVQNGETFSSIGRLYGLKQSALIAANPKVIPTKLRPGQTLLIPGQPVRPHAEPLVVRADGRVLARKPDPLGTGVPVSNQVPAERTRTGYLVEDGETLTQIAQRFHTTERELRQLNRLGDSDTIYAGRYILVPFIRQAPAGNTLASRDS